MSTTYRFVRMSEINIEKIKKEQLYHIIDNNDILDTTKGLWISINKKRIGTEFSIEIKSVLLPVEPFSPLSEEEVKMKAQIFNSDFAPLHRDFGMLCFTKAVEWVIERMEGKTEALHDSILNSGNVYGIGHDQEKNFFIDEHGEEITFQQLFAIFREEQKRKKEKP